MCHTRTARCRDQHEDAGTHGRLACSLMAVSHSSLYPTRAKDGSASESCFNFPTACNSGLTCTPARAASSRYSSGGLRRCLADPLRCSIAERQCKANSLLDRRFGHQCQPASLGVHHEGAMLAISAFAPWTDRTCGAAACLVSVQGTIALRCNAAMLNVSNTTTE